MPAIVSSLPCLCGFDSLFAFLLVAAVLAVGGYFGYKTLFKGKVVFSLSSLSLSFLVSHARGTLTFLFHFLFGGLGFFDNAQKQRGSSSAAGKSGASSPASRETGTAKVAVNKEFVDPRVAKHMQKNGPATVRKLNRSPK